MPLIRRCSLSAFNKNVSELIRSGRKRNVAVAAAISTLKSACKVTSKAKMTPSSIVSAGKRKKHEDPKLEIDFGEENGL